MSNIVEIQTEKRTEPSPGDLFIDPDHNEIYILTVFWFEDDEKFYGAINLSTGYMFQYPSSLKSEALEGLQFHKSECEIYIK